MDIAKFKEKPLMGILRGVELAELEPLVSAIMSSGLETVEITMNTKDAPKLIRQAKKLSGAKLTIGAGTVLSRDNLIAALDYGATFIVMPVFIKNIVEYCVKKRVPVFAGALSPQEIYNAASSGVTMVKVFPASVFGPEYFKEIKGPFNDIELLACGGVRPENLKAYFASGASAAAIGSSVFKKEWLKAKDFNSITEAIKKYLVELEGIKKNG